ncbi:MAG TPA: hypothetical protein VIY29_14495 [Ktedonobacteraceae bacterium]
MIVQPSAKTEPSSGSMRSTLGRWFLRVLLALSLVYYAVLVLDLVLHPFETNISGTLADRFVEALTGTGVIVVGAFIMRRVPGNRVGPLLILYGVGVAGYATRADLGSPLLTSIAHLFWGVYYGGVALPALIVLLLSFPTGQIYPRWAARWVTPYILLILIGGTLSFMSQSPGGASSDSVISLPVNPFFVPALAPYNALISQTLAGFSLLFLLGVVGVVVSLTMRYRAAHTRERQQIKWLIWMTVVTTVVGVLLFVFVTVAPNDIVSAVYGSPLGYAFILLFYSLVSTFPVIGIGLAILRHRLWEIDIIINRTLVYGSLTALLALLYFGLIFALQSLFQGMFHQNNAVAIVVSTLVIAALFQPLRHRIQRVIDRLFYRRKYDAARTLAAFSVTLRNEVDLTELSERLIAVVEETMQPAHVSLWLRPAQQDEKHESAWTGNTPPSS